MKVNQDLKQRDFPETPISLQEPHHQSLPETPTIFGQTNKQMTSYTTEDILANKSAINKSVLDNITGKLDLCVDAGILFGSYRYLHFHNIGMLNTVVDPTDRRTFLDMFNDKKRLGQMKKAHKVYR